MRKIERDLRRQHCKLECNSNLNTTKVHSQLLISITTHFFVLVLCRFVAYYGYLNSTYVIEESLSFTLIIDHQRYEELFKESIQVQETISGFHT